MAENVLRALPGPRGGGGGNRRPPRRPHAARGLSRGAAGAEAAIRAGARLSRASDRHRLRGDRGAAGLCRPADRVGVSTESTDAAVAHAGAERAVGIPARDRMALAVGRRGDDRVDAREPERGVSRAMAAGAAARAGRGPSGGGGGHRASRARSRSSPAAARRYCAHSTLRATSSGRCRCGRRQAGRRCSCARVCLWRAR